MRRVTVKSANVRRLSKNARQHRQMPAVVSANDKPITGIRLIQAREMVVWITSPDRVGHWSFRRLATYTPWRISGYGNWQHIAKGDHQVRLTLGNFEALKRIYDLLQSGYDANLELLESTLKVNETAAIFNHELNRHMRLVNEVLKGAR